MLLLLFSLSSSSTDDDDGMDSFSSRKWNKTIQKIMAVWFYFTRRRTSKNCTVASSKAVSTLHTHTCHVSIYLLCGGMMMIALRLCARQEQCNAIRKKWWSWLLFHFILSLVIIIWLPHSEHTISLSLLLSTLYVYFSKR